MSCIYNRDRAKLLRESLSKLERYREALSSNKRQRSELSLNEKSNLANAAKAGGQIHRNPHDMAQRLKDRTKSTGLNKRIRTSVADVRVCTWTLILITFLPFYIFIMFET